MSKPFNVRIYALLIANHQILILREPFMGDIIWKFPGGGLEFGEGTRDCLIREFREELNLDVEVGEHFYTQDFFLQSALNAQEQILMIYYKTYPKNLDTFQLLDKEIQDFVWRNLDELTADDVSLSTDKMVVEMLREELKRG